MLFRSKVPSFDTDAGRRTVASMVALANLTREGFRLGDLSTLMSPRSVISWAENAEIFGDVAQALRLAFVNKCDEAEWPVIAEYFQRCFEADLFPESRATGNP